MEKLYNNIILPDDFMEKASYPNDVPYLKNPPEVINITVGRQLFVDDFLIEKTDLEPEYHKAIKYEGNPILWPETELEREWQPYAAPVSGGVWFDEEDKKYKMWYAAGWCHRLAYAESNDGINWVRPNLHFREGTNQILPFDPNVKFEDKPLEALQPDSCSFIIDYDAPKDQKFKLAHHGPRWDAGGVVGTSADGINWTIHGMTGEGGDRCTAFYNPFRKKYVFSIRSDRTNGDPYFRGKGVPRTRDYWETDDFLKADWGKRHVNSHRWMAADIEDIEDPYIRHWDVGLYNVDAIGYESIMLGWFQIHWGQTNEWFADRGAPKITEFMPMYSRNGYNFSRPNRQPLIWASRYRGAWDRGYVQCVTGGVIIHGDELWIYYAGMQGDENSPKPPEATTDFGCGCVRNGGTGLAKIRRDGFVSMNGKGKLLTRKMEFTGKKTMGINAIGKVSAKILNEDGNLLANSKEFEGDSTNYTLDFGGFDISSLNDKIIRIEFDVDGKLFAFGFADENGDYGGAHAAGIAE